MNAILRKVNLFIESDIVHIIQSYLFGNTLDINFSHKRKLKDKTNTSDRIWSAANLSLAPYHQLPPEYLQLPYTTMITYNTEKL